MMSNTCKLTKYFDVYCDSAIMIEAGHIGTASTSLVEGMLEQQPASIQMNDWKQQ